MLIQFLKHGKGGGKGPIEYLTSKEGREIAPEVLYGDPQLTRDLIDSLEFTCKYTSGVIAFHKEDDPSQKQIEEMINEFEKTAFAGLEPDQYNIFWVKHTDKDKTELHFIVPRVELSSGKSMNICPPGQTKRYDNLRSYFNEKYSWAKPEDMHRKQEVALPKHIHKIKAQIRREWGVEPAKDFREVLHEAAELEVSQGKVQNREDLLKFFETLDLKVTRKGKNYITVTDDEGKKYRLKGDLYSEQCSAAIETIKGRIQSPQGGIEYESEGISREFPSGIGEAGRTFKKAIAERGREVPPGEPEPNRKELERLYGEIEISRTKRAEFNQKEYGHTEVRNVVLPSDCDSIECVSLMELANSKDRVEDLGHVSEKSGHVLTEVESEKVRGWIDDHVQNGISRALKQVKEKAIKLKKKAIMAFNKVQKFNRRFGKHLSWFKHLFQEKKIDKKVSKSQGVGFGR